MDEFDLFEHADNFSKYKHVRSFLVHGNPGETKPYISIVIPTYRRSKLLKEAIDSALNQENVTCDYEIVIVDNEAVFDYETETEKLIKTYSDSKIMYYKNEKNIGMYANWNRCVELARGQWVAFLHDDDILSPNYLNTIEKMLKKKKDIGAICVNFKYDVYDPDLVGNFDTHHSLKQRIKHFIKHLLRDKLIELKFYDSFIMGSNVYGAPTCGTVFRKDYFISAGGVDERYFPSADWFFMIKFNRMYKVYKTLIPLGSYRVLENESLNLSTFRKFVEDGFKLRSYVMRKGGMLSMFVKFFEAEYHVKLVDGVLKLDKTKAVKPSDFDYLIRYRIRPFRKQLLNALLKGYYGLRNFLALLN